MKPRIPLSQKLVTRLLTQQNDGTTTNIMAQVFVGEVTAAVTVALIQRQSIKLNMGATVDGDVVILVDWAKKCTIDRNLSV